MCPPADQAPAVLGQADASTMPLSDSNPDSAVVVSENTDDSKSDPAIKSDEAHDVLAPLPSETETAVTTGGTGGLATIKEQIDPTCPNNELATVKNKISESATTWNTDCEASDHHAPTGTVTPTKPDTTTAALPSPKLESAVKQVDINESAGLVMQQESPDESATRSTTPEAVADTNPTIVVAVAGVDQMDDEKPEVASAPTVIASNDPANSEDHKLVDPNDKENIGNVIKFFYTSSTRKRPSSPVAAAPGCCNPRLHRDSDLYVKAKGQDGRAYVFEVVSATLEKASPKFEAMIYGSHTRGNKEEWVWELDDDP